MDKLTDEMKKKIGYGAAAVVAAAVVGYGIYYMTKPAPVVAPTPGKLLLRLF